jgi:hypothetical protein
MLARSAAMNGEAALAQRQRVDRRETPILPGAAQRVGRRADPHAGHDEPWSAQASAPCGFTPTARSR